MEKVYIVVVTREGEEGASVEPVAYRDIADARRRAREIEETENTEYPYVPEDIFNSWPMDDICNSPIPSYEGYSYGQYKMQEARCDRWTGEPVHCEVAELSVEGTAEEDSEAALKWKSSATFTF